MLLLYLYNCYFFPSYIILIIFNGVYACSVYYKFYINLQKKAHIKLQKESQVIPAEGGITPAPLILPKMLKPTKLASSYSTTTFPDNSFPKSTFPKLHSTSMFPTLSEAFKKATKVSQVIAFSLLFSLSDLLETVVFYLRSSSQIALYTFEQTTWKIMVY